MANQLMYLDYDALGGPDEGQEGLAVWDVERSFITSESVSFLAVKLSSIYTLFGCYGQEKTHFD